MKLGMYKIKRLFPNKNFEKFSGITGRKEIVSMGMLFGNGEYLEDIYMVLLSAPNIILRPKQSNAQLEALPNKTNLEEITKQELEKNIETHKKKLNFEEQIIYFEKYLGENFIGRNDFEFCGFDLMDDGLGTSAIIDCGDLNKKFVNKLNKYGLLDSVKDAISTQEQLAHDYPDEEHAIVEIYGVWRYINNFVK